MNDPFTDLITALNVLKARASAAVATVKTYNLDSYQDARLNVDLDRIRDAWELVCAEAEGLSILPKQGRMDFAVDRVKRTYRAIDNVAVTSEVE